MASPERSNADASRRRLILYVRAAIGLDVLAAALALIAPRLLVDDGGHAGLAAVLFAALASFALPSAFFPLRQIWPTMAAPPLRLASALALMSVATALAVLQAALAILGAALLWRAWLDRARARP